MRDSNTTDRIFREKLGDYASETPMHIWDRIEQKRSRRGIIWWWGNRAVVGIIILLSLSGVGWYFGNQATVAPVQPIAPVLEQQAAPKSNGAPINLGIASLDSDATGKGEGYENHEANEAVLQKTAPSLPVASFDKNPSNYILSQTNESTITPTIALEIEKTPNNLNQPNELSIVTTEEQQDKDALSLSSLPSKLELLAIARLEEKSIEIAPLPIQLPDPTKSKGCPSFDDRQKFRLEMDILGSPDFALRSLTSKSPDNIGYLRERERTESSRYAFSGGLRLSLLHQRGFALRTGFMYAQIDEKFEYLNGNAERITINNIFDQNGNIIGTDTLIELGSHKKVTFNRFHTVDIPLIAGFQVETRNWMYSINAGVYFNVMFHKKGDFLAPNMQPVSFSTNDPSAYPAFRKSLGLSFYGSISLNYKISDKLQWVIEPHFRYYTKPVSKSSYILNQQYLTMGMLTGLRVIF